MSKYSKGILEKGKIKIKRGKKIMNKKEIKEMKKIYEENKNKYKKAVNEYNKYEDLKHDPNSNKSLKYYYSEIMAENMAIVLNLQPILFYFERNLDIKIKDSIVQFELNPIGKYSDLKSEDTNGDNLIEFEEDLKIDNQLESSLLEMQEKRESLIEEINDNIMELRNKGNYKYYLLDESSLSCTINYLENKKKEIEKYRMFINK